ISYSGFGQAGIVINNNVNMVMNSGVYIVVDNAASSAVATAGTGGNIISEAENNIIKWNIGTSTGNYIIPFTTASGIKIPLSVNITSPGTGTGNIEFSTYNGPTWNNDTYRPTGVTNMTNMGVTNNSSEVIDRFWIIDANGYTVMPSGDIKFNYDDAEHLAAGNTITESDLKAERYEDAADDWEIFPVGGIVNTVSNDVSGVPFSSTDFMRTWTLIDQTTHILPIVLLSFEATCFSSDAVISWQTAQEINTDHFILESSINGENFTTLASINAAGNSNTERSYSFIIKNYTETYYRLKLVNTDASVEDLGVVSVNCSSTTPYTINAYASGIRQITLQTFGLKKGIYYLECFDIAGKEILHNEIYVDEYFNEFIVKEDLLAEGIYILRLNAQDAGAPFTYAKKIPILF
ncbi:MAG: hypothetical protein ACHQFW_11670, partial [Chitinophagales bacterium]